MTIIEREDEIIEVVQYPLEDTMNMIDDGKITDALTMLALQRTWIYLHRIEGFRY